ncbi:hypothetical protein [Streptomyces sp. NPDC047014]|uniref:hypothetical protein n=1 Tax=Streptomyces sp. NPDC047014 TaxID=3155736 RepID=UPI0034082C9A
MRTSRSARIALATTTVGAVTVAAMSLTAAQATVAAKPYKGLPSGTSRPPADR